MLQRHKRLLIAVSAAVLLAGAALGTSALAETPTPGTPTAQPGGQRQDYRQVFLSKLAGALGIDQTKLNDSIKKAQTDTIDQAVQNGDLAKNRADDMKQRVQQGNPGFFGPFGGRFEGQFGDRRWAGHGFRGVGGMYDQTAQKAIADKLGMSVQDLQAQLRSGKSLSDVAKDKGVSEQDLRSAAATAVNAQLDQAVKDGKLTQQQEDSILQRIQQGQWPGLRGKPQPGA